MRLATVKAIFDDNAPFSSVRGREMMKTRRAEEADVRVLAGGKGLAIDLTPEEAILPPWGVVRVVLTAFANMPGEYDDLLRVRVGLLPESAIRVRCNIIGTPLSVRVDRNRRAAAAAGAHCHTRALPL